MGAKTKNVLKTILKLTVSGVAMYIVFRNIDWKQTREVFFNAHSGWLVLATIAFVLSKVVGSFRLNCFFKDIGLHISEKKNLKLYWIGLFYNLFLPGGIGGDGYKVYLLNKQFGVKVKPLIQATLWDRVSGLLALVILGGIGYLFIENTELPKWIWHLDVIGLIICLPVFYWVVNRFFSAFKPSFLITTIYSFGVQISQVICAYFILLALGVEDKHLEYQVLFLVSSVVSVLPFTIGGIGARELTFILGYQYFGISENISIAFSLLFFIITAVTSVAGVFFKEKVN